MTSDLILISIFEHQHDSAKAELRFERLKGHDKSRIFQLICNGTLRKELKEKAQARTEEKLKIGVGIC